MSADLAREDLLSPARYAQQRGYYAQRYRPLLDVRRVWVGPDVLLTFENRATLWYQLQEMLHLEQGGADQLDLDLPAYRALLPQGRELVAALLVEIGEAPRRRRFLARLAEHGVQASLQIDSHVVPATPAVSDARNAAEGRAGPTQFLRFALSPGAAEHLARPGAALSLLVEVGEYRHLATLSEAARASLAADLAGGDAPDDAAAEA